MKRIYLLADIIIISITGYAQNVGIGINNPSEKLQVAGNIKADTAKINGLVLDNGFMKVSGTNRTAFVHTATIANTVSNYTKLSYANQLLSDIVIVTHNYNPLGGGGIYVGYAIGVYWTGTEWTIYREDGNPLSFVNNIGPSFNVLVIKQ